MTTPTVLFSLPNIPDTSSSSFSNQESWETTINNNNNHHQKNKNNNKEEISRRVALVMTAAAVAAGGNLQDAVALPLSGRVEALEYENLENVNRKGAPEKHLPKITILTTTGSSSSSSSSSSKSRCSIKVVVPHVMDPIQPHFIEYLWLKDEDTNKVIKAKHFSARDPSPPTLIVTGVTKGTRVRALLFCNLHGLWQGDIVTVG